MLQFSTQNKIRINLCSIFFYKKIKFGSSYIAIVLTKQNPDQPMLQFSTHKKKFKTKFGSTYVAIFHTKKNRINLCCNFPHKTKFGSTYVAIFHAKQNSNQPMLQFSTQNKIRVTCPRMWGPVSVETRKYISNRFRHAKTGIPSLKAITDYDRHWKRLFKKRPNGTRMESSACSTNISPYTWKHKHAPSSEQFQSGLK